MEKITSKNNTLIKHLSKLSTSVPYRKSCGEFVLEGVRLCFDVLNSSVVLETLLYTDFCREKNEEKIAALEQRAAKSYVIGGEAVGKLAETVTTQGVFCLCKAFDNSEEIDCNGKYIALEMVQDPSNLGAVARTAEAMGLSGLIISGGADIYNPKAMRSSMGSLLRLPVINCQNLVAVLEECREKNMSIFAAVPDSSAKKITAVNFSCPCITLIGNEGNGLSEEIKHMADERITIPMSGRTESLNASTAAALAMWEMMRGEA